MSYNRDFLDSYVPNKTAYVPEQVRKQLYKEGKRFDKALAAGTYAREICQRLLIDLAYNSSRLEGTPTHGWIRKSSLKKALQQKERFMKKPSW